jgi:hypothetical protein
MRRDRRRSRGYALPVPESTPESQPTQAEALAGLAAELRAFRQAFERSESEGGVLDLAALLPGLPRANPKARRARQQLTEAERANRLATFALVFAGIAAVGGILTGIATLIAVL